MTACRELGPDGERTDQMQIIFDGLFEYIDACSGDMAGEYISERDRWMASATARDEALRQIPNRELTDAATAHQVRGCDLIRHNLALTLWYAPTRNRSDTAELQTVAHDVLTRLGATGRLVVPVGAGPLWAWGLVHRHRRNPPRHRRLPRHILPPPRPVAIRLVRGHTRLAGSRSHSPVSSVRAAADDRCQHGTVFGGQVSLEHR
ncbi:hypothetical protein [Rhodococcus jostii]|uniref:hypothetical protein n=1 Tax=Rhodococcus jostii TaxID=132919 RepID=UPI0036445722